MLNTAVKENLLVRIDPHLETCHPGVGEIWQGLFTGPRLGDGDRLAANTAEMVHFLAPGTQHVCRIEAGSPDVVCTFYVPEGKSLEGQHITW